MREQTRKDVFSGSELDIGPEGPVDAVQVWTVESNQRGETGHYCYCEEFDYPDQENAFEQRTLCGRSLLKDTTCPINGG